MTMYKIYWTDCSGQMFGEEFADMGAALNMSNSLRCSGANRFITMSAENTDQVGQMGVDAVVNGKLPNGEDYTWKMRRL